MHRRVRGVGLAAVLVSLFGLLASAPGWAQAGPDAPPGTDTGTQPTATVICPLGTDPAPGGPGQGTPGGPTGPDTPGQGTPGEPGGPGQGTPGGPNGPDTPGQGTPGGTTGSDPQPTVACPPETFGSISATPTVCNIDPVSGSCSATITWGASGTTVAQVWRHNLVTGSNTLFASAGSGQGSQVASGIDTQTVRFELLLDGVFEASVDVVGNLGPSVALSAPLGGAVVTANAGATLTASASDADGVSQVAFFDGATLLGTDTTAPYSLSWVPTVLGSHTLSAQATDARGAVTSTAGVAVTVVRVKLTASNKTVGSTVAFGNTASATFRLATAGKIRFQTSAGGTYDEQSPFDEWLEPESATSGAQFEVQAVPVSGAVSAGTVNQWWSLGNATPRDWTLTRTAAGTSQAVINVQLRQAGTSTVLASTNVTLNATVTAPPNGAPVANLTAPTNGSVFTAPATLTLTATASDADGTISQVAFYKGTETTPFATDTTPDSNGNYSAVLGPLAAGSYTLKATATDNAGGTGSSTVTVIVNAPPSVTMPTPPIQNAPCTWALSATASDSDGTIGQVQFFNGAVALPGTTGNPNPDTSAPYGYTWSAVPAGTYTLTAKATDNRGAITTSSAVTAVCNALPTVDITAPVAGSTQPTSFDLTATATDSDGSIASVQFFEGAVAIHTPPLTTAPYTFRWNNVALGSHTVTAQAIDNRGAIKTSNSVTFTVADVPPTATLTAPANGASYIRPDGPIVSATASTSAGTITKVEFLDNGAVIGSDTTPNASGQYTFPSDTTAWNTTNVTAGSHTLTARATNSLGTVGPLSTPVTITLLNPNPAAMLTSPSNGASFAEKAPIPLAATASIALGSISQVEFFDGAVRIGLPDTSAPYAITDWTTATIGTHVLTAKATSSLSTSKVSTTVTITVTNPPPTITLTAPSAGANFAAPATITLSATASDANGTISKVEFFKDDGATLLGTAAETAPPYTYEWRDVPVGNYTITAKATDNLNASTSTPAIAISVTEPVMCFVLPAKPGSVP
ncbi:MAG: Ig-like domain-containing protein [Xanthomonadaceae bacterium]|nr:Ig-like domain-containing protein [Xanthomonadaceae bacterium]